MWTRRNVTLLCAGGVVLCLGVLISGIADFANRHSVLAVAAIVCAIVGLACCVSGLVQNLRRP